jgi:hypothetical protein
MYRKVLEEREGIDVTHALLYYPLHKVIHELKA